MKRLFLALIVLAQIAIATAHASAEWGGQLKLCIYSDPKTFNPLLVTEQSSDTVRYLTGGRLLRFNRASLALEPELARTWTLSKDGREIRFEIRPEARFSDGAAVTARDAAFTFRALLDPALHAPDGEVFRAGGSQITVEAAAERTFVVRFSKPVAGVERLFAAVAIVKEGSLAPASKPVEMPVAGPFRIAEYHPGSSIVLERNPYYWKTAGGKRLPYLDSVRLEIQQNRSIEMARFLAGELDLIDNVDPESFSRLSGRPGITAVDAGPSLDSEQMWFNQASGSPLPDYKKHWFALREFRRAVSSAVNREDICRLVFAAHASPAAAIIPACNRNWADNRLRPRPFDPAEARRLLESVGFRLQGGVLQDAGGHRVEFSIVTNAGNTGRERMAALIQQDLSKIGILVRVVKLDFPSLIERITRTFDYEACLLGMVNDDLDPSSQSNVWLSSGPNHQWNPNQKTPATEWEAEIDRLIRVESTEVQPAARKKAFDRVQAIVWEQEPFLYLVAKNALSAYRSGLGNASPSPLYPRMYWNADQLYINRSRR